MNKQQAVTIPINDIDGLCTTILAGCYKFGSKTLIGGVRNNNDINNDTYAL